MRWSIRVLALSLVFALVVCARHDARAFGVAHSDFGKVVRWKKTSIPYHVNPAGSADISDGSDIAALHEAFTDWTGLPCAALEVTHAGDAGATNLLTGVKPNGKNEVTFVETSAWKFGQYVLGVTAPLYDFGGTIGEADIALNGFLHSWSTKGGFGKVDVKSIAIHEVGHLFGIQHNLGGWPMSNPPTMAPAWDGTTKSRTLEPDDKLAFCFLYPAGGSYGCSVSGDCPYVVDKDGGGNEYYSGKYECVGGACQYQAGAVGGDKALGDSCATSQECKGDLFCQPLFGAQAICTHLCSPGSAVGCEPGFACAAYQGGQGGACVPGGLVTLPDGSACESGSECDSGLCAIHPLDGTLSCRRTCKLGASPDGCKSGQVCIVSPNVATGQGACFAGQEVGGIGKPDEDPCEADFQCYSHHCVPNPDGSGSFCRAACDPEGGSCSFGFWCVELTAGVGACMPGEPPPEPKLLADGSLCLSYLECASRFCYQQAGSSVAQCRAPCSFIDPQCPAGQLCIGYGSPQEGLCMSEGAPAGAPCQQAADCSSGLCVEAPGGSVCSQQCLAPNVCPCGMSCIDRAGPGLVCIPDPGAAACKDGGAACESTLECESGLCEGGACAALAQPAQEDTGEPAAEPDATPATPALPIAQPATRERGGCRSAGPAGSPLALPAGLLATFFLARIFHLRPRGR